MKKPIISTIVAFISLLFASITFADNSDNHQITVLVNPINEISVTGGNVTLTINSATAGNQPDNATDNTTCDLSWTTNETNKKIAVVSSLAKIRYTLTVAAINFSSGGSSISEVLVGQTGVDFITDSSKTTGSSGLQFVASATAAAGANTEVHTTVTYTLIEN